jgi:copper chaperone CopZ
VRRKIVEIGHGFVERNLNKSTKKKLLITTILSAVASSLCCITPVLAFVSGASGLVSTFSWVEPARPWLITLSGGTLAFAWYRKFKPRREIERQCACEVEERPSFMQSRRFLGIVTVLAVLMIAFPWYAEVFFPAKSTQINVVATDRVATVRFDVEGMTCGGCEAHIRQAITSVPGVVDVTSDYGKGEAVVRFYPGIAEIDGIRKTINETGYHVIHQESAN